MYVSLTFCLAYLSAIAARLGRAADGIVDSDLVADFLDTCVLTKRPIPGDPESSSPDRVDGDAWTAFRARFGRVLVARAVSHKAFEGTDFRLLEAALDDAVRLCPRLSPSLSPAATEEEVRRLLRDPVTEAATPMLNQQSAMEGPIALLAATRDIGRSTARRDGTETFTIARALAVPAAAPWQAS